MLARAYEQALFSPDPSTQVGAIIVERAGTLTLGTGCNEFPRGVHYTPARLERPLKYEVIEHAERNAIFDAAFNGRRCKGATMYLTWGPCSDCARAVIQAGISRVVRHADATERAMSAASPGKNWSESTSIADIMLRESGVEIIEIHGKVMPATFRILHLGEQWSP